MINIKLLKEDIEISSDRKIEDEAELYQELTRVLCFTIAIYKHRLEKLRRKPLSELDEAIVNQKIRDSILSVPIGDIREFIRETELT